MAHGDFASPAFNDEDDGANEDEESTCWAENSPLLRGLSHPCTFNVAIETERTMWINSIGNEVTFKINETLANSADTVHGGFVWNAHEYNVFSVEELGSKCLLQDLVCYTLGRNFFCDICLTSKQIFDMMTQVLNTTYSNTGHNRRMILFCSIATQDPHVPRYTLTQISAVPIGI
jgi:hypothetical protein